MTTCSTRLSRSAAGRAPSISNLALLADGLRAEREQGITIDVAYRYFSTPKRKFILADTPGHVQYTRNMVTGASTANVALIIVDARPASPKIHESIVNERVFLCCGIFECGVSTDYL